MGSKSIFKCASCGYEAEVSGGIDCGFHANTETMICVNCRKLVDVLTGIEGKQSKADIGLCPECSTKNVNSWDQNDKPCPRCEGEMEQGPITMMWD